MADVRNALRRFSEDAGQAPDLDAILRAKNRRHRRRRAGGFAVGVAFAAITAIALIAMAGPDPGGLSGLGASGSGEAAPATTPYLWPENWATADGAQDLQDLENRLGSGDPGVQWRLDPEAVVERFAQEVLGWAEVSVRGQQSAATTQWWEISPVCGTGSCDPTWRETVRIDRLPASQAWVVTSVEAEGLSTGLEHGMDNVAIDLLPTTISGAQGVTLSGYTGPLGTIGVVAYDGCRVQQATRSSLSPGRYSIVPDPPVATSGCPSTSVGYMFAYASSGGAEGTIPTSDAIDYATPGLTLVPIVLETL
jgi:hypothetical protein